MSSRSTKRMVWSGALGAVCGIALLLSCAVGEYSRVNSPDGRFYAVATFPAWKQWIPMMAGQAGDKAGWITVYSRDGVSCGSVPVDMVSSIRDLKWGTDSAELGHIAKWHLSVQTMGR